MWAKSKKNVNVVLVEPEIPNNTGNIGRTCVALEAALHLVKPMAFTLEEKKVRRAGLDYWPHLDLHLHESQKAFFDSLDLSKDKPCLFTTKTQTPIFEASLKEETSENIWLIFGKETKGLSEEILKIYSEHLYTLPMIGKTRSLNLANSVAVGLYETYRQLELEG